MSRSTSPLGHATIRSGSRSRGQTSRPTTPLRPSSRSSLRDSGKLSHTGLSESPLEAFEPAFAELADSMADLEANFMHLQLMHESLSRFSESFASFLYGLNMNAFCVDFPEAPILDSFRKSRQHEQLSRSTNSDKTRKDDFDSETTFMTTDTSFVDNPSTSAKVMPAFQTPAPVSRIAGATRGASAGRGGGVRGGLRGTRSSGLARAKGHSIR